MNYKEKLQSISGHKFYDWNDPDLLSHEDPISAVEDCLESYFDKAHGPTYAATIQAEEDLQDGLEIEAYDPCEVTDKEITWAAQCALEKVQECFDEDFGPYDDGQAKFPDLFPEFKALTARLFTETEVWRCEVVGKVHLTKEDLLQIVEDEGWDNGEST